MRVTLVHNPGAGGGEPDAATLVRMIREAGHDVTCVSDDDRGWEKSPGDLIAVAGGDGTVGRVAKAMAGRGVPLAALPLGTANNISRSLGATDVSLEQIVASWSAARRVKLDVGVATGPWGRKAFIESVGLGVFAWVMPKAAKSEGLQQLEDTGDKLVYALQMLKDRLQQCKPLAIEGSLDGRDVSGEYLMLEAMSIPFIGPNLYLAPHSSPSDGSLDVALINERERQELFTCLAGWQRGALCRPNLPTHSGRHLTLEWTGFALHIDDEVWPAEGEKRPAPGGTIDITLAGDSVEFLEPGLPVGA